MYLLASHLKLATEMHESVSEEDLSEYLITLQQEFKTTFNIGTQDVNDEEEVESTNQDLDSITNPTSFVLNTSSELRNMSLDGDDDDEYLISVSQQLSQQVDSVSVE
jgi:hypothetical protein